MVALWHMWPKSIQAHATREEPAGCLWLDRVQAAACARALGSCGGSVAEMTLRGQRSDPFKLIFGSSAELLISHDAPPVGSVGRFGFSSTDILL